MADGGLGVAANALQQFAGLDAAQLIAWFLQYTETARQNRRECRELAIRLRILSGVLTLRPSSEMMRRPGAREALDGLDETLRQACVLLQSFQKRSGISRILTARKEQSQLREIGERMDFYLSLYPVVSHADLADRVTWLQRGLVGVIVSFVITAIVSLFTPVLSVFFEF